MGLATGTSNTLWTDGTCNTTTGNITSLNADMVEIVSSTSSHTPGSAWGSGLDEYIWVAGYSGVNNGCTTNYSGITVGITPTVVATMEVEALPWSGSAIASQTVDHVDVAVGFYYDATSIYNPPIPRYFVLAVYQSQGNIYLDQYNVDIDYTGTPSFTIDVTRQSGTPFSNNGQKLNTGSGDARYPHISLIYEDGYPTAGQVHKVIGWVVTWEENNEIWGCDGPISVNSSNNPAPPNNTPFYIDDGKFPDIKGVTAANTGGSSDPSIAYVTYLNTTGDEVHLSWWEYGTTTVTNYSAISGTTTSADEFHYPRIAGPQYFDYSGAIGNDPVCVVAVDENDGSSNHKVNTYAFHDPNGTPVIRSVIDASDYSSNGFNGAGYEAMKPVITGAGSLASGFYTGSGGVYTDYPTVFYADYDHSNITWTTSGDIFACGTDVANTASPSVYLDGGTDYFEVNPNELQFSSYLDMNSNQPYIAAATTHNSGHNMFVAYYAGDRIYRRVNTGGGNYAFKRGKTTGVQQLNKTGIAVYPNPVNDRLNITNANGAGYTVFDVTGRILATGTLSGTQASVDASPLVPGMYMLHISKDGHTEQVKFVKQ